jgi:hypothetical protein
MLRQLTFLVPFVTALSAGSVFMATLASAGPASAEDGPKAAIVGTVASVSGSTYTMGPGRMDLRSASMSQVTRSTSMLTARRPTRQQ